MRLLDPAGREWGRLDDRSGYGDSGDEITIHADLSATAGSGKAKPEKLVVDGPITATAVDRPYDPADLPLP